MTPEEEGREIFNSMYNTYDPSGYYLMCFNLAKQCSIVAIDKIIKVLKDIPFVDQKEYWLEVRKDIENYKEF